MIISAKVRIIMEIAKKKVNYLYKKFPTGDLSGT